MTPTIRLARPDDAGAVAAIYEPAVTESVASFETEPPDTDEMQRRIERTLPDHPWLVCERDGEVVGYACAGPHRERAAYLWSVDVSAYVHPDHRRRGVGRGLYESLFAVLKMQGFVNAYAGIALPNEASVGLHESMGFERVGVYERVGYKRGAWRDVGWWHLALSGKPHDPEPPIDVTTVKSRSGWDDVLAAGERVVSE
jgi:phosphinothricin acetyltransferase